MSYRIRSLVSLVGLSMVVGSCKESETNTMSGSLPSNDGGNGTVDDSGGFYVKVVSKTNVATSTHAFEGFNTECKIAPTASGKDLRCMVHIREISTSTV